MRWLAALLLFPSIAFAVAPELCGSGLDEPGNTLGTPNGTDGSCPAGYGKSQTGIGCDLLCPGNDGDNDGYTSNGVLGTAGTTAIDCDDTDKWVFPGVYTGRGCGAGQVRQCHATNGSFSACVNESTICEATGTGVCYHVDCTSGNDANAGTYAAPFKSLAKVSGGSGGSGMPASPVTLAAGDVVYVRPFSCTTTMTSSGGRTVIAEFNANGTLANPITIKAIPKPGGITSIPFLQNTNGQGIVGTGDYYKISGVGLYTARGTEANGTAIFTGSYWTIDSVLFYSMAGHGDNNDACLYSNSQNGTKARRSVFLDCMANTGNSDNIGAIKWLDDEGFLDRCQDHEARWNGIVYTTLGAGGNGNAFHDKRGCEQADVGANKHPIQYNSIANAKRALYWSGSSLRFSNNLVVQTTQIARFFVDGSSIRMQDNEVTDNTFYVGTKLEWGDPLYTTPEKLTILRNVFYDTVGGYAGGNNDGIYSIDGYGSAGNRTTFETSPFYLSSNNNCFYNPNTALVFSYFNQGDSCCQYSFANWKLRAVPYDAASFVENPNFDAYYQAQSANCLNKGRLYSTATPPSVGAAAKSHVFSIINRRRRQ